MLTLVNEKEYHNKGLTIIVSSSVRSLLAFLFIPLLQKQLDIFKETISNSHRIRCQKDTNLPSGVPNHIYSFPGEYGLEECGLEECGMWQTQLP